jgi:hypothetical protein
VQISAARVVRDIFSILSHFSFVEYDEIAERLALLQTQTRTGSPTHGIPDDLKAKMTEVQARFDLARQKTRERIARMLVLAREQDLAAVVKKATLFGTKVAGRKTIAALAIDGFTVK